MRKQDILILPPDQGPCSFSMLARTAISSFEIALDAFIYRGCIIQGQLSGDGGQTARRRLAAPVEPVFPLLSTIEAPRAEAPFSPVCP